MSVSANKTYFIASAYASSKRLNLYNNGSINDGTNVVLWSNDTSDDQKWFFDGERLYPRTNRSFCLDRYTDLEYTNNADIWRASNSQSSAQVIKIEPNGGYYRIKLKTAINGYYYYLTVTDSANGNNTNAGKQAAASGNVYWAKEKSGTEAMKQNWVFTEVTSSATNPYENLGWKYVFYNNATCNGNYAHDPSGNVNINNHEHFGIDVICAEGTNLYAPESATVIAVGGNVFQNPNNTNVSIEGSEEHDSMGYFVVLKMDDKDPVTNKNMYVRYLHLQNIPTLRYGDRVSRGSFIGRVGDTGLSSEPHLHLDINTKTSVQWYGDGFTSNNTINPVNFFPDVDFRDHYYTNGYYG